MARSLAPPRAPRTMGGGGFPRTLTGGRPLHRRRLRLACIAIGCGAALAAGRPVQAQETPGRGLGIVDAVRLTLAVHPDIRVQQRQADLSRANLRVARSQFDPQINASLARARDVQPLTQAQLFQAPGLVSSTLTNLTSYKVGYQKQFRSGLVVTPSVEMVRQDLNLPAPATNRANVWLSVTQPLARGRGRAAVTASERAAELDVEASELDLRHRMASAVARTALSYWTDVAARMNLAILQESEGRARRLLDDMQLLVDAGTRPAADLTQLRGNLVDRTTQRVSAEQAAFEARQNLGLAVGLPFDQIETLPPPGDAFPEVDPQALAAPDAGPRLIREALGRRADLEASRRRQSRARAQRLGAQDAVKPQVDLVAAVGFSGLDEGSGLWRLFSPLAGSGLNASVNVVYGWPIANNGALGALAGADAAYDQSVIQSDELARAVGSGVAVALNDLHRSADRIRSAREARAIYTEAIENERQKLQFGLSTIIDVIVTEDRLTRSRLDEVAARLAYAQALVRLRFETGTLVDGAQPETVALEALTTVPVIGGSSR